MLLSLFIVVSSSASEEVLEVDGEKVEMYLEPLRRRYKCTFRRKKQSKTLGCGQLIPTL